MNRRTGSNTARTRVPDRRWRRGIATAAAGTALLSGCGQVVAAAQEARPTAAATPSAAPAGSVCVQATPLVQSALGVLRQLGHGAVASAGAQHALAADQAGISRLARAPSDPARQEYLAVLSDAFAAFRAVMQDPNVPAYPDTRANLTGQLAGFRRACG